MVSAQVVTVPADLVERWRRDTPATARRILQGAGGWAWDPGAIDWQGNEVELNHQGETLRLDRLVRRRSGGGAVFLERTQVVWADLGVPAGDELWQDHVGRASWWLGEAWAAAVASVASVASVVDSGAGAGAGAPSSRARVGSCGSCPSRGSCWGFSGVVTVTPCRSGSGPGRRGH